MQDLASLLKNRGLTLMDLANELKVNKGTVSRWNKKKVPLDQIEAVEKASGIAICDLRPDLASIFASKQKAVSQ